jgi:hypothetical protein
MAERTGDFSAFPVVNYDPGSQSCTAGGVCTRAPFAGNIIPANRISQAANYLQAGLPTPRNNSLTNNFISSNPVNFNINETTDKVDWNLGDKHRFYGMYSHGQKSNTSLYSLATLPLPYGDGRQINEIPTMAQAKYTCATSNLLNQIGLSFTLLGARVNVTINGDG